MSSTRDRLAELYELAAAQCDGTLAVEQLARLEELVISDAELRRHYVAYTHIHATAEQEGKGVRCILPERPEGCFAQNVPDPFSLCRWTRDYFSQPGPLSILAAAIFMVCLISLLSILPAPTYEHIRSNHACTTSVSSPGRQPRDVGKKLNFVARITGLHNCKWSAEGRAPLGYDHMAVGRELKLDSGMVKITYKTGANIILEGPVEFTVEEENACRLNLGKLTAKVSKQAVGFAVETPTTKIVDLGTEFGVEADRQGKTEVAVFLGAVEVGSESGGGGFRLTAGQAARVDAKGALTVLEPGKPDSRPRFVRHMPGAPPPVHAGIIVVEHIGANDPETQDPVAWVADGIATAKGAGTDETDELAHWYVKNDAGKCYYYMSALSDDKLSDPDGWTATAVAKLVTADSAYNASFAVSDGSDRWVFTLVGGPGVSSPGVYTLGPILANRDLVLLSSVDPTLAYHTYQIVFDPLANNGDGGVTFYMDGQALLAYGRTDTPDLPAEQLLTRRIIFGDCTYNNGASESHWASCRFETGQRPIILPRLAPASTPGNLITTQLNKERRIQKRPASTQLQKGGSGAVGVP